MAKENSIQWRVLNNLAKEAGYKSLLQLSKDTPDISYAYLLGRARDNKLLDMSNRSIEKIAKALGVTPSELRENIIMQTQAERELGSGIPQIDSSEVPLLLGIRLLKKKAPVAYESIVNLVFHLTSIEITDDTPK